MNEAKLLLARDSEVLDFLQLQRRTTLGNRICAAAIAVTTMRVTISFLLVLVLSAPFASAQSGTRKTLDIYVVDVEGGNAVLFVAPSGDSMLVDTGNGGDAAVRDAGRIMAAVKDAGIKQIDHLIITHYHNDHIGGLSELAKQIPIKAA